MGNSNLSWDLYRSFLAVFRTGSLSQAARELGLTQPTLGRHIDALEESFGSLFVRSQKGFMPTELAYRLVPYAESLEVATSALFREASNTGDEHVGTVRITASEIMGSEVLPQILTELNYKYPKITIELVLSNRVENLLTREADIAIRMDEPKQKALIAQKIGDIEIGLHAHRSYFERRDVPKTRKDLLDHSLIGFDTENEFIRSLQEELGGWSRDAFTLRSDSDIAHLSLIRSGFGIGFCQVGIARRDKNLQRVLSQTIGFSLSTWVLMHENLKSNSSCMTVYRALVKNLSTYAQQNKK